MKKIAGTLWCLFNFGITNILLNSKNAKTYFRRLLDASPCTGKGDFGRELNLPSHNIDKVVCGADSIPVNIVNYYYTYGDMPLHELMVLCKLICYYQPQIVFEIGTFLGGTTLQIAANCEAKVYTLDLPPKDHKDYMTPKVRDTASDVYPDKPGIKFYDMQYEHRISQLFGNSQTFDFSPYYGKVDFVFVDGCHHYDFVLRDSVNALKMKAPGGIVVWHDYAEYEPGVVSALNELNRNVALTHIEGTSLVIKK